MMQLDTPPPQIRYLIARAQASRYWPHGDRGEVGIVGTIIMVVGFAVAAALLVAAVKGKLQAWIGDIPG
jgi:hypothetical protein